MTDGWVVPWSGGKDSTATIITMLDDGIPIDKIIHVRMMATETLPAGLQVMNDFIDECTENFKSKGLDVEIVKSKPFDELASKVFRHSKYTERVGHPYGFYHCSSGMCSFQMEKTKLSTLDPNKTMLGICYDEPRRMREGRHSILFDKKMTQADAYALCKERGLLSPLYELGVPRDGCFFCPNAKAKAQSLLTEEQIELIRKWARMTPQGARRQKDWRFDK